MNPLNPEAVRFLGHAVKFAGAPLLAHPPRRGEHARAGLHDVGGHGTARIDALAGAGAVQWLDGAWGGRQGGAAWDS